MTKLYMWCIAVALLLFAFTAVMALVPTFEAFYDTLDLRVYYKQK